jgi:uncharacterized protein YndB with AHSA1/START domain
VATYVQALETTAPPETLWRIWSDPGTWPDWNRDVRSMTVDGPFAAGSSAVMTTAAGRTHRMTLLDVQPPRSFALETRVIPGTRFVFTCRVDPHGTHTRISQSITIGGPLGPAFGPMAGKRIAAGFRPLLAGLARKAGDIGVTQETES